MTSRLPSVWPAYMDNKLYFFDDESLSARNYTYTSNYGMIPVNIIINDTIKIPSRKCLTCSADTSGYTYLPSVLDEGEVISGECSATCKCRVISFERISKIYGFFKDYYYLLHHRGHCNLSYSSATAFYSGESANYAEEMPYGTDEEVYKELDRKYSGYGESDFYEWICDNVIPTYTIPKQYQDYWQRETLYYPDVIKWIGWFDARSEYSAYTTESSCKNITRDCCECVEYVKRGGLTERNRMKDWYNTLQGKILTELDDKCYSSYTITQISIQSSIDDLGEMSIFCEEYKEGVDYRTIPTESAETHTIIHYESGNTHSGTTVIMDGELYKLTSGSGYVFDSKYMETKFDKGGWESGTTSATSSTTISGYTASKLKTLHVDSFLTDDIGNTILGVYDVSGKTNHQPSEGEVLEPIYQVSAITNVSRYNDSDNTFIGDMIDEMKFYFKPIDGEVGENDKVSVSGSVVDAIDEAETKKSGSTIYYDDVFCDITYHVGNIYSGNTKISGGVEYQETVQFVKEKVEYYLKQSNKIESMGENEVPSNHSISYPIYVYTLKQKEEEIRDNTYNTPYADSLAEIYLRNVTYNNESGESENPPMFREEYKLGMSAPQNVSGDIYIDRGINSAFEKHIKISEVVSLEDMLQYGNGYFKIMDN